MQRSDDDIASSNNLPQYLQVLFGLAGATLSLPSLAMTCLINDQIAIPVMYLPVYYAVAFLPYSFKPIYSLVTYWFEYYLYWSRHTILSIVLFGLGLTIFSFGLLSKDSVLKALILAFTSGLFSSWSDLLMSFVLLQLPATTLAVSSSPNATRHQEEDHVRLLRLKDDVIEADGVVSWKSDETATVDESPVKSANLSLMQTQAATCRNVGSYIASLVTFGVFFYQYIISRADNGSISEDGNLRLHPESVMVFLAMTASLPLCSIVIVQFNKSQFINNNNNIANTQDPYEGCIENCSYDYVVKALSLVAFQSTLVIAALRSLIIAHFSAFIWNILFGIFASGFIISIAPIFRFRSCKRQYDKAKDEDTSAAKTVENTMKRICIYILLRNALPTPNILLGSFTYLIFSKTPLLLQSFYILQLLATTSASWFYQRYISKYYYSGRKLKSIIVCFTVLNSACILCYICLFSIYPDTDMISSSSIPVILFVLVTLVSSFVEELAFLPNVILASITATNGDSYERTSILESNNQVYAFLVSCIDFGDQISAWITVPLIEKLGLDRGNGWKHMNQFLWLCAILGLVSICFLPLLP